MTQKAANGSIYHVSIYNDERDITWDSYEGVLILVPAPVKGKSKLSEVLARLPKPLGERLKKVVEREEFKAAAGSLLSTEVEPFHRVTLAVTPKQANPYFWLEWGRKVARRAGNGIPNLFCEVRPLEDRGTLAVDALVSASRTAEALLPRYSAKKRPPKKTVSWTFLVEEKYREICQAAAKRASLTAEATNLVRELATQAGNDLTPKVYIQKASAIATQVGLKSEFLGLDKLKKMKAGAFLAVAQGNNHQDSGVLKVTYTPKKAKGDTHVVFVGKGITYDTGGQNLKIGNYMFGMHEDMTGSALALALAVLAAKEEWPFRVTSFLAITENVLSPAAYRPNDVVTSLSGRTIEVVDTDAEGRMVLADTLFLATQENPTLLLDFATLTGSCIRAIGTHFSGAYTNRARLHPLLRQAGTKSGERVWPFPVDPVFGRALKSSVADLKQCRVTGGVDHLEAAYFLSQFVGKKAPWVHIDLSAAHNEGGLGHVSTKTTGFGVRFAREFVHAFLNGTAKAS